MFFIWLGNDHQETISNRAKQLLHFQEDIKDKESAQNCLDLVKKNLAAATEKKLEAYLATLSRQSASRHKKELSSIDSYDLEHELIAFKVLEQRPDSLFVEVFQRTSNQGTTHYQNHIAQIHYTFMIEAGEWKSLMPSLPISNRSTKNSFPGLDCPTPGRQSISCFCFHVQISANTAYSRFISRYLPGVIPTICRNFLVKLEIS